SPPSHLLDETVYTQPALFALEYALAQLWLSWGIRPSVVMGHSVGEYVAACIAGVFSLEDGLKLIAQRAKLMQALPQVGEMVAIFAAENTIQTAIQPYADVCSIAAINGAQSIVISGAREAVGQVVTQLKSQGVKTRKLQVSHAFHSPLMEPILAEFEQIANQIDYFAPRLDIISNLTGDIATQDIATPQYWVNHVRQPVKFSASIERLDAKGYQIFLEIGPKPTLLGMGRAILEDGVRSQESEFRIQNSLLWLSSLRPGQDDWQQLLHSLAVLSVQGIAIDWQGFDKNYQRHRVVLPTYPFQRQRYWIENREQESQKSEFRDWLYQVEWQAKARTQESEVRRQERQCGLGVSPSGATAVAETASFLIFADKKGLGKTIAQQLHLSGYQCLLVYPDESYRSPTP
ncbi:MAG: acyltransferase domain-containing protein, partial [Microcystaceae cyanobacterium]